MSFRIGTSVSGFRAEDTYRFTAAVAIMIMTVTASFRKGAEE